MMHHDTSWYITTNTHIFKCLCVYMYVYIYIYTYIYIYIHICVCVWITQLAAEEFTKIRKADPVSCKWIQNEIVLPREIKDSGCPAPPSHAAPFWTLKTPWPSGDLDPQPYPPCIAWATDGTSVAHGNIATCCQEKGTSHQRHRCNGNRTPKTLFLMWFLQPL